MGSAKIYLRNDTDSNAELTLYHTSANFGTVSTTGADVAPGAKIGPLNVSWNAATPADFWYVSLAVSNGERPGVYVSRVPDDLLLPYWKECMLIGELGLKDDESSPTFTVDWDNFSINLKSGGCRADMIRTGDYSPVQNVFVLMLENHSFDNIFAFSGIEGITHATTENHNSYNGTVYGVNDLVTPTGMPTDPGHEFADILTQLCGTDAKYVVPDYPDIDLSGFAASYATSNDEKTGQPAPDQIGDIMACFNTPSQLPVINHLATNYVICDHWFSSLPGPTWPNRFYVHGASSAYWNASKNAYQSLDDSPTNEQVGVWESVNGFTYQNGSIYNALNKADIPWRIYHDDSLNIAGAIPQVTAIKGISLTDVLSVKSLADLQNDLHDAYPYRYTFIEPNYGDITGNTYEGGSSQHPKDDVAGGENLIAKVYNAISQSPLWKSSVLIITYDEHGGFYDSVPPGTAVPPSATDLGGTNGFVFNRLGVRVPAVIVSPLLKPSVDSTVYDHSSVLATVEKLFGLAPLTARDAAANDFAHLFSDALISVERPPILNSARPTPLESVSSSVGRAARAQQPMPASGNLLAFLAAAKKTDVELSSGAQSEHAAIEARLSALQTRGDAEAYITDVMSRVRARRVAHAAAVRAALARESVKKRNGLQP